MDKNYLQNLRGAVARRDGPAVVAALGAGVPTDVLQLAGEGLQIALEAGIPEATRLAGSCIRLLRDRGWAGDEELAEQLEAALGRPLSDSGLHPLPVDLGELSMILDTGLGEEGGVIDRQTGEVWNSAAMEYAGETEEDPPDFEPEAPAAVVFPSGSQSEPGTRTRCC